MKHAIRNLNIYYIFLFVLVFYLFSSCENNTIDNHEVDKLNKSFKCESTVDERILFAEVFASAIDENNHLRIFLKNEFSEKNVYDNTVLYHQIKNKLVDGKISLRTLLAKFFDDENQLIELENNCPLLALYIPELPEKRFSVEIWNASNQIPKTAVFDEIKNTILFYKKGEYDFSLKAEFIPAFPVILIKDCNMNEVMSRVIHESKYDFEYRRKYDNIIRIEPNRNLKVYTQPVPDSKVVTAYNIYSNADGWQRDYVYYDISPSEIRGEFKYTHQETLTSFKLGAPNATDITPIFRRISDSSEDPGYGGRTWADGSFTFQIKCKLNSKTGIGEEIKKIFMIKANLLFDTHYNDNGTYYSLNRMYAKTVNLNLHLFNWDLYDISPSIKISIEELDPSEAITLSSSETTTFASNFEFSSTIEKVGRKFGTSNVMTRQIETQTVYNYDSDKLGDTVINFADKIILNGNYDRRKYYNSSYTLTIEPKKVQ
jgi:hypothetical protein